MENRSEDLAGRKRDGRRAMPFSSPALTVLGSTGSIGTQTLDVARMHGYRIKAMSAHSNFRLAEEQAREFLPETVCMTDDTAYRELKARLADTDIKVTSGKEALCETAVRF